MIFGWVAALGLFTVFFVLVLPKDDLQPITTYRVDPTSLNITLSGGESGRNDIAIWEHIVALLPRDYLSRHVENFHLFSDGMADTLAYVEKTNDQSKSWILAVDRTDYRFFKNHTFTPTIIHEFAHILALDNNQLNLHQWACNNFSRQGGCFKTDAYINQWYQRFWQGRVAEEHRLSVASVKKIHRKDAIEQFYAANSDSFVSEYASSDAVEDFAESFVRYVLDDVIADQQFVYAQKISFFKRFPTLVDVRNHIRSKLMQ